MTGRYSSRLPALAASSLEGEVAFVGVVPLCHAQKPEPRRVAVFVGNSMPIDYDDVADRLPNRLPPVPDKLPRVVVCQFGHRHGGFGETPALELGAPAPASCAAHAYAIGLADHDPPA